MSEFPERYESVCCRSGKSPEQEWAELGEAEAVAEARRGIRSQNRECGMNQRLKCSYASKYKAVRAPTCGCQTCEAKWEDSQAQPGARWAERRAGRPNGELLKIAAELLDAKWASDDIEDWPQFRIRNFGASRAASDQERRRQLALRIRAVWDKASAASAGGGVPAVTDADVEAIAEMTCGPAAWDCLDPKEIIGAVLRHYSIPAKVRGLDREKLLSYIDMVMTERSKQKFFSGEWQELRDSIQDGDFDADQGGDA